MFSDYDKFLLPLVGDKSFSELLCIIVNVCGKVEHDSKPQIIGSYFDISVVVVGIEECAEETIAEMGHQVAFTGLFICQKTRVGVLAPHLLLSRLKRWYVGVFELVVVDFDDLKRGFLLFSLVLQLHE